MLKDRNISITEAAEVTEPVDLASVKAWLTIDYDTDDALLSEMIIAARQDIEQETGLALVEKEVVYDFTVTDNDSVRLPYVISVEDIVLTDENAEPVDSDNYKHRAGVIAMKQTGCFSVSYTTANTVPAGLKEAIKMLVAYRYNNRGDSERQEGMPEDIERKISKYRQTWL